MAAGGSPLHNQHSLQRMSWVRRVIASASPPLPQALHDWAISVSAEAAAGRAFELSAQGGGPLTDPAQTLAAANVSNAMLTIKWVS
jgi:hypothetical protein